LAKNETIRNKVVTYLNDDINQKLANYARGMGISVSASVSVILATYFQGMQTANDLGELLNVYKEELSKSEEKLKSEVKKIDD